MYMYMFMGREMEEGGGCGAQRRAQAPPPSSHYGLATTMYILALSCDPFYHHDHMRPYPQVQYSWPMR